MSRPIAPLAERLEERITRSDEDGGCWLWTGCIANGYGRLWENGRQRAAHRLSFEFFVGMIPDGLQIDHLCHNRDRTCSGGASCPHRRCVNPDHLEPVTAQQNMLRSPTRGLVGAPAKLRAITHCPQGHAYDEGNTYLNPRNQRICRTCARAYTHRWRRQKRDRRAVA